MADPRSGTTARDTRERHRLFFAMFPDPAARNEIARLAARLKPHTPLRRWIAPERYHVTLHFLGDSPELRRHQVDAAIAAAGQVGAAPFELVFDQAASFVGKSNPAFALRCSQTPSALQALWQGLKERLIQAGFGAALLPAFVPHATIGYVGRVDVAPVRIEPVVTRPGEFVLVHSLVGSTPYQALARWPIVGES